MWQRIKNLWKLSERLEVEDVSESEVTLNVFSQKGVAKKKQSAIFIPRIKPDPVKAITQETL